MSGNKSNEEKKYNKDLRNLESGWILITIFINGLMLKLNINDLQIIIIIKYLNQFGLEKQKIILIE